MLKIRLEDTDKLYDILVELGVIAYLQGLVQYDAPGEDKSEDAFAFARKSAESYLLEWQMETVLKFKQLLEREDFTVPESKE